MKRKGTNVAIALSALFLLGGPLFLTACGPTDNPGPVGPIYGDGDVLNFDVELCLHLQNIREHISRILAL